VHNHTLLDFFTFRFSISYMEPPFVVAKIIGSPGVVGWERRSHTFLHNSNVIWRFRFFISISTCSRLRELKEAFACEGTWAIFSVEFGPNLNQGCSGNAVPTPIFVVVYIPDYPAKTIAYFFIQNSFKFDYDHYGTVAFGNARITLWHNNVLCL